MALPLIFFLKVQKDCGMVIYFFLYYSFLSLRLTVRCWIEQLKATISLVVSGGASRGIMVISSLFANGTILFYDTDAEQFLI